MHDNFDCDDIYVELGDLIEYFELVICSILMPSWPFASKSITLPNDLDEKIEIA
jgi:hypothetical protein